MAATGADADLRNRVEQMLLGDLRLNAENLDVEVSQGTVRLKGSVPNYFQKQEAVACARLLVGPGVTDELTVEPPGPMADHEVKYEAEDALVRDRRISRKLVHKEVSVEVSQGVVILTGMVDLPAEKHIAEEDVWSLPGVAGIRNEIVVALIHARADDAIYRDVAQTIVDNPWIDSSRIAVAVQHQVVDLTGSVPTREQKRLAGDGAWWVPGVRAVRNNLVVTA